MSKRRRQPGPAVAPSGVELGLDEKQGPGEVSAPQVGAAQIGAGQVGQPEVGPAQVSANEAGPSEVGAAQIGGVQAGRR